MREVGLRSLFAEPAAANLAAFVRACSAPDPKGLIALDGEVETSLLDRALGTDSLCLLKSCVIVSTEKEISVGEVAAQGLALPRDFGLNDEWSYFSSHAGNNHYGAIAIPMLGSNSLEVE